MLEGELTMNFDSTSKGLFFIDSDGGLVKVGPVEVSSSAPNSSPEGEEGNMVGELWYDENTDTLKIWHDSEWKRVVQEPTGYSGSVTLDSSTLTFSNGLLVSVST
jgi:hypothetical protein